MAAIVNTLGPLGLHVSPGADLNRLLSLSQGSTQKFLPKWNLSVVLNDLTKAHFEPMKDTDLALKTAF